MSEDITQQRYKATCKICSDFYTDARQLHCGHNYCLNCIKQDGKIVPYCPNCQLETSYESVNCGLNHLVGELIRKGEDPWCQETKDRLKDKGEEYAHSRHFVICDHCLKRDWTGIRYKCGICDDYDLCEDCFQRPRSEVHDLEHIMIRIPAGARRHWSTNGKNLIEAAIEIGLSMDYEKTDHDGVTCSNCKAEPIKGWRFKCGMCEDYDLCSDCIEKSQAVHDSSHFFLVLSHPCKISQPCQLIKKVEKESDDEEDKEDSEEDNDSSN